MSVLPPPPSPALSASAVRSSTQLGIVCAVCASLAFSILDATSQLIGLAAPMMMVQFFRNGAQGAVATGLLACTGQLKGLRISKPGLHILRGLLMLLTTVLAFMSLRTVSLADFTAIVMLQPLVMTLLSSRLLNERVSPLRWALAAGGFIGVLFVVRPLSHSFEPAILYTLLLVAVGTVFQLLTVRMMRTENSLETYQSSGITGMLASALALPFVWQPIAPKVWGMIALLSLASCAGHLMLMLALKYAKASVVSPYLYTQLGFAILGGWIVFNRVPDAWGMLGIGLIAVCGIANAWLTLTEERPEPLS